MSRRAQAALFPVMTLILVAVVFWIHGYHPFADDAALYGAGIKHLMRPDLYSASIDLPFLSVHQRFSIYEGTAAGLFKLLHLSPEMGLFLLQIVAIWLYLIGLDGLARRLFPTVRARMMTLLLGSACFALPVAGSGIFIMDPFVTARSFTAPMALFLLCAVIDRRWILAGLLSVAALLLHPLMGVYLAIFAVSYVLVRDSRWWILSAGGMVSLLLCGGIYHASMLHTESVRYQALIWGRRYLFLATWKRYELIGLGAPLVLLAVASYFQPRSSRLRVLALTCVFVGSMVVLASLLFVHLNGSYLLARVQLIRGFQIIYMVGMILLAGWLGRMAQGRWQVIFLLPVVAAIGMHVAQRLDFPASPNVEIPGVINRSPWHLAFLWMRENTPKSAVIAADPDLMDLPGEGHESPRPTAERAVLASNKDGGVAVLSPDLADAWTSQRSAQLNLAQATDEQRLAQLSPFGVTWILLPPQSQTSFACPFQNRAVKICRLM